MEIGSSVEVTIPGTDDDWPTPSNDNGDGITKPGESAVAGAGQAAGLSINRKNAGRYDNGASEWQYVRHQLQGRQRADDRRGVRFHYAIEIHPGRYVDESYRGQPDD